MFFGRFWEVFGTFSGRELPEVSWSSWEPLGAPEAFWSLLEPPEASPGRDLGPPRIHTHTNNY